MKSATLTVIIILFFRIFPHTKAYSQFQPSVYVGFGMPNTGGVIGLGTELKYKWISLSVAAGPSFSSENNISMDVGLKAYSNLGVFGGVNYGVVRTKGDGSWIWKDDAYGFSFTAGYRRIIYKQFYGTAFIGFTSDNLTFMSKSERQHDFIFRGGLLVGYEF